MNVRIGDTVNDPHIDLDPAVVKLTSVLQERDHLPLHHRSPAEARQVLERIQSRPAELAPAEVEEHTIPGGPDGAVSVTVVKPLDSNGSTPTVVYSHGGGWMLGSFATHERLIRELTVQSRAAFVFVNYSRAPERGYPIALEEVWATIAWVARRGSELGLDGSRLAIAGDGAGGNLTAAAALLSAQRGSPTIRCQVLLYPVLDASFDTDSHAQFGQMPWMGGDTMRWFWDAYLPDHLARREPTASPLRASREQLAGMPPALLITVEADVVRDEAEAFGRRLQSVGVDAAIERFTGVMHDFMMLDALASTAAARRATTRVATFLHSALFDRG